MINLETSKRVSPNLGYPNIGVSQLGVSLTRKVRGLARDKFIQGHAIRWSFCGLRPQSEYEIAQNHLRSWTKALSYRGYKEDLMRLPFSQLFPLVFFFLFFFFLFKGDNDIKWNFETNKSYITISIDPSKTIGNPMQLKWGFF